jgi:hypothetical protein
MSYGKLNIWFRDLDCGPKNVWRAELVVKTCGGEYLVDFNPDVIDKLREALPGYSVEGKGSREGETTIVIRGLYIKHIEVDVPPGCYIVRAWVCSGNLWSDRAMAIVRCGGDACVNLIVPEKEDCIREVIVPVAIAARDLRLDPEKLRIATEVLMTTGRIRKEPLVKELTDTAKELEKSDEKEAAKYVEAFKSTADLVRRTRLEKE